MKTTLIHSRDDGPYHDTPTHIANGYPAIEIWRCVLCDQPQPPTTWRFFAHRAVPAPATCGPDSPCFTGPLCPRCADRFGIASVVDTLPPLDGRTVGYDKRRLLLP